MTVLAQLDQAIAAAEAQLEQLRAARDAIARALPAVEAEIPPTPPVGVANQPAVDLGRPLTIPQAAGLAEKVLGRAPHYSTIRRWIISNPHIGRQTATGGWVVWAAPFEGFLRADAKNATFANGVHAAEQSFSRP